MKGNGEAKRELPRELLVEAALFVSYLTRDALEQYFHVVVEMARDGAAKLVCSSEVYDDVISALRSQGVELEKARDFVNDMRKIPHRPEPMTVEVACDALGMYRKFGGARRLHYFDSFHVATARATGLPLLTSDRFIITNASELGIPVLDIRRLR